MNEWDLSINGVDLAIASYDIVGTHRLLPVKIVRIPNHPDGKVLWAICQSGYRMNRKGEWEWEPTPSNRSQAFHKRCQFASVSEAVKAWEKSGKQEVKGSEGMTP